VGGNVRGESLLIGREAECELVDQVLEDARSDRSRALLIRGEPGIGKSSLLAYAIERATGFLVLRATGFESESEVAFSGLLQLLRPVIGRVDELSPYQANAIRGALGLESPQTGDRLSIGAATLALLAVAAEDAAVLVAVDDVQWLDDASVDAILFAARRFEVDPLAVIVTARDGGAELEAPELDELHLGGLDRESARLLLAESSPRELSAAVIERIYALTQGNPLALVELPRALNHAQFNAGEPLEEPLNLGAKLQRAFRYRVETLSPGAQQALLIASASDSDRLDTIATAVDILALDRSSLQEAEDAGVVALVDDALLFRHPLVRSAIYDSAAPSEQRAAHALLAQALADPRDVERRAWHLAAAALGPGEDVAEALEHAAAAAAERNGPGAASATYERAARFSTDETARLRRLHDAAETAWRAGRIERAIALLEETLGRASDRVMRGRLLNLRGHIEHQIGRPEDAYGMLVEAAAELDGSAPLDAAAARMIAYRCTVLMNDVDRGRECAQLLYDRAERDDGTQEFFGALALGLSLGPDSDEGRRLLDHAISLTEEKGDAIFSEAPNHVSLAGMGCKFLAQPERGLALATWAAGWARDRGNYGVLPVTLNRKATYELLLGRWSAAYTTTSEAAAIAVEQGTNQFLPFIVHRLAWIEAQRGEESACRAHVEEARRFVEKRGDGPDVNRRAGVLTGRSRLAMLDLAFGRLDGAIAGYEELVVGPDGETRNHGWIPDLVEAYVRNGQTAEAEGLIAPFAIHTKNRLGPVSLDSVNGDALLERCRGLVAADEDFEPHFLHALELHRASRGRYDEARTRLCYGERLRRTRRRRDARDQLRPALAVFEELLASPWADRARAELRATGEHVGAREPSGEQLTAQELRIALQAADGKTSRQIGAALFLSPKTVEFHLGRVYRKLGIGSRAELIHHFLDGAGPLPPSSVADFDSSSALTRGDRGS
jgi:DNA-binding CsgD family transcriptional regulator